MKLNRSKEANLTYEPGLLWKAIFLPLQFILWEYLHWSEKAVTQWTPGQMKGRRKELWEMMEHLEAYFYVNKVLLKGPEEHLEAYFNVNKVLLEGTWREWKDGTCQSGQDQHQHQPSERERRSGHLIIVREQTLFTFTMCSFTVMCSFSRGFFQSKVIYIVCIYSTYINMLPGH